MSELPPTPENSASDERFRYLIENGHEAVILIDPQGQVTYASPNLQRVLGFSPEEYVGTSVMQRVHPDDLPEVQRLFGQILQVPQKIITATIRSLHKDGEYRWIEGIGQNWLGIGPVDAIVCNIRDVTPEVRARQELNAAESLNSRVLEALSAGVVRIDEQGLLVDVNSVALNLFQAEKSDLLGKHYSIFGYATIHPDGTPFPPSDYPAARCMDTGETQEAMVIGMKRRDGSVVWAAFTAAPWRNPAAGEKVGTVVTFVDVTTQMRVELEFRAIKERFDFLSKATNDAVWDLELATGMLQWNTNLQVIFGYDPSGPVNSMEFWADCIHPDDQAPTLDSFNEALNTGINPWTAEYRFRKADGSYAWVYDRGYMLRGVDGNVVRAVGAMMDISRTKEAADQLARSQDMLRQAQKMESLGQMAGGVAHDFNNILTVIEGHAELLKREFLTADGQESINEIIASVQRASGLTRQLLTFSRKNIVNPEVLDLNEVIHSLGKMLARILGEHIALEIATGAPPPHVRADRGMVEQIVMNLAINARDAMPEGGRLVIASATGKLPPTVVPNSSTGHWAILKVRDTGCGIPKENMPKIFEPFFTTKDVGKGTGLGLATVYGIVQQHSGHIQVQSSPGEGAAFSIYLPLAARETQAPAPVRPRHISHGSETILVVEDEPALLNLATAILQRFGYKVLQAPSGVQALKVWQEHKDQIHLVLTDMVMPERISGRSLGTALLEQNPGLKIIYTSGYSQEMIDNDFVSRSGGYFLPKPYTPEQLLSSIRKVLDS